MSFEFPPDRICAWEGNSKLKTKNSKLFGRFVAWMS
jgi:hypothetical protein